MTRRLLVPLVAAVLVVAACSTATQPTAETRARALESRVWSPYCPGRLLADCPTRQSDELRERIERRLERGESTDEVLAWLRANYGDEILAAPSTDARGVFAWVVPGAAVVAAAILLGGLLRRWSRGGTADPPADDGAATGGAADDEEWIRLVREEVDRDP